MFWNKDLASKLRENYQSSSLEELSRILHRTPEQIVTRLRWLSSDDPSWYQGRVNALRIEYSRNYGKLSKKGSCLYIDNFSRPAREIYLGMMRSYRQNLDWITFDAYWGDLVEQQAKAESSTEEIGEHSLYQLKVSLMSSLARMKPRKSRNNL